MTCKVSLLTARKLVLLDKSTNVNQKAYLQVNFITKTNQHAEILVNIEVSFLHVYLQVRPMEDAKFESILMRIASVTKSIKPKDLARILEISPAAVSKALTQHRIPKTWYNTLVTKYNLTHSWLMYGDGTNEEVETGSEALAVKAFEEYPVACPRCARLEEKLDRVESQRDDLFDEMRQLWKENSSLKDQIGKLNAELALLKNDQSSTTASAQSPMAGASGTPGAGESLSRAG